MFLSIGKVASLLGVSVITLRRWDVAGFLVPAFRSSGGHRRYCASSVAAVYGDVDVVSSEVAVGYASVSSHDQKDDLERQRARLAASMAASGECGAVEVMADLGSGLNFKKRGLNRLISLILSGRVRRLYVTHRDRLLRFGYEIIDRLVRHFGGEIKVVEEETSLPAGEEKARDVLSIITVFSARLYGKRSHVNRGLGNR